MQLRPDLIAAAVLALAVAAGASPALAQARDQQASTCENHGGSTPLAQVIAACTALIQGGTETQANLGVDYMNRGNAYDDSRQPALAITDYNKAVSLNPQDGEAYYNRALSYQRQGDFVRALADYNQALQLIPNEVEALVRRGEIFAMQRDVRAFDDFNKAISLNPNIAEAYYDRGTAYATGGNAERAINDFDKAIALEPKNAFSWANRCQALATLGQKLDQAQNDCTESLRLAPNDSITLASRALVRLRKGDFAGSKADYDAALSGDPRRMIARYGRGVAELRLGQLDAGHADISAATEKDSTVADVFKGWGVTP